MNVVITIAIVLNVAILVGLVCWQGWRIMRRQGMVFMLIVAGFLFSMATKMNPPPIEWGYGVSDNGTEYTNQLSSIVFKWRKTDIEIPNAVPLHIASKPNGGSAWQTVTNLSVGAFEAVVDIDSTNFSWKVWIDYAPPVHTNGVWLGNVLEKAKGDDGVEKILIIHGNIFDNERKLNP